jgi:hypothetical protein
MDAVADVAVLAAEIGERGVETGEMAAHGDKIRVVAIDDADDFGAQPCGARSQVVAQLRQWGAAAGGGDKLVGAKGRRKQ